MMLFIENFTLDDKEILVKYIQDFMKEALNEECDYKKAEEKFNKYFERDIMFF